MNMKNMTIAMGICGGLFLAYCVYFDKKRRSDPNFKQKLYERRVAAKQKEEKSNGLPDLTDLNNVQDYFIRQVTLGEHQLMFGNAEQSAEHLSNACLACASPSGFIKVLQSTVPTPLFELIMQKLSEKQKSYQNKPILVEEDVE